MERRKTMTFEKNTIGINDPIIIMPMSCDCGKKYDKTRSQGSFQSDQDTNSGKCQSTKS